MVRLDVINKTMQNRASIQCFQEEIKLRRERFQHVELNKRLEAMHSRYPYLKKELLERMLAFGFCPESAPALGYAPIAMVAWGSGSVTFEERQVAASSILETELRGNIEAIRQFSSWFDERPEPVLQELWRDFTIAQATCQHRSTRLAAIDHLHRLHARAIAVAKASGGFMGLGSVCGGEGEVLDLIAEITAIANRGHG